MYCEKPLSVTLAEGLALRAAVQKYGVVFQWGTQQRSSVNYRLTAELVRNGYIGDVRNIMIGIGRRLTAQAGAPRDLEGSTAGFDYDRWLGPSPYVPYSDVRVSLTWMFIRDYGIGCLGGAWGIHDLDAAQFFFDTDDTTPIEIEGRARYYEDIRDVPYSWTVEQKYANGANRDPHGSRHREEAGQAVRVRRHGQPGHRVEGMDLGQPSGSAHRA